MSKKHKQSKRHNRKLRDIKLNKLLVQAQNYHQQQDLERAKQAYQQVLEHSAANVPALHGLGRIALDIGMLDTAAEFFTIALQAEPGNIAVNKSLALLFTRQNRIDEAIELYSNILRMDSANGYVCGELARLYLLSGDIDAALEHFRQAFEINPSDPKNLHGLIQLNPQSITPEVLKAVETQLEEPDLALNERSSFYFALGAIHDRAGRYDEAFANYSVANLAKPLNYDADQHSRLVTNTIDTFTSKLFEKYAYAGNSSSRPVFIIGMPRSGTTLVEQILASHPDIHAAGELNHIEQLVAALSSQAERQLAYPQMLKDISSDDIRCLADSQLQLIDNLAGNEALRVTDKMPLNFLHLGLIALLFPNAHIIHCRRNPLDTCLSCYFQNFSGNHAYAGDLENLGHFYRQYERLMLHWYSVLPVLIHTVDYEKLIDEPESTSRQLLAYLGLDWDEACLQFHHTPRQVQTASLVQVRRPLYRSSVERWREYDKHLSPLKAALANEDGAVTDVTETAPGALNTVSTAFNGYSYGS